MLFSLYGQGPTVLLLGSLLVVEVSGLLPDLVLGQLAGQLLPAHGFPRNEEVSVLQAMAMAAVEVWHCLHRNSNTVTISSSAKRTLQDLFPNCSLQSLW